ncbi:MAG: MOSC domain-containing protein [Alphaproteobacteria bacterium]
MPAYITDLYRYPLQGTQGQTMPQLILTPLSPPPYDRVFGIVEEIKKISPVGEQIIHKLRGDKKLLSLCSHYDETTKILKIYQQDKLLLKAALPKEDQKLADVIAKFLGFQTIKHPLSIGYKSDPSLFGGFLHGRAVIAGAYKKTAISIINHNSLRDFAKKIGEKNIDKRRFRANIYIDNLESFTELSWVGRDIKCGKAILRAIERTARCAITEINPDNAMRDFSTLTHLKKNYQHLDMGIYAEIINGATISIGDELSLLN